MLISVLHQENFLVQFTRGQIQLFDIVVGEDIGLVSSLSPEGNIIVGEFSGEMYLKPGGPFRSLEQQVSINFVQDFWTDITQICSVAYFEHQIQAN